MKLILEDVPSPVSGDGMGRQYTGVEMACVAKMVVNHRFSWAS